MISTRHAMNAAHDGSAPRATPQNPGHTLNRSIAFMNQKGGVGKTTTVVNLAAAIAEAGRTVLVADLDPQAHATLHFGVDPEGDAPSLYDLLTGGGEASGRGAITPQDVLRPVRDRIGLLPSSTDLAAAETELAPAPDRLGRLARALEPLRSSYEFIFMDCPPSLGLLTLNALVAAREVIVPMQAHFLALQGTGKLLETVTHVAAQVNPRLRVTGVVLCMHEDQTRHSREVVDDIRSFFREHEKSEAPWAGARVYSPAVRRNIKLAESPSFGQTIFEYAPTAPGADDYRALGARLVEEWDAVLARVAAKAGAGVSGGAAST